MSLGGRRTRCDVPSAQAILDLGILFSTKCNGSDLPFNGPGPSLSCGCSSVVEHDLAKIGVEGSNPFARSKAFKGLAPQVTCDAKP